MASQRTQVPTAVTCSSTPAALSSFPVLPHFPCDATRAFRDVSPGNPSAVRFSSSGSTWPRTRAER